MTRPFFSVIIPAYNRYESLKRAIESVLNQSFRDFELIIVDDGSTDKTPCIRHEYEGRIAYIRQDNSGVSSARNRGIGISKSPYIAFLDSDDLWMESKLEEQYRFIRSNPEILIQQTDEIWIRNGKRVNPMKKHMKKHGEIFMDSLSLCMISPSSVILKGELFDRFGLFDERLPVCEDYDLWLRITSQENVGLIDKKLIVKYGGHDDQLSDSYWGMDRFRVFAMVNLLINYAEGLKQDHLNGLYETIIEKCRILRNGSLKRGKRDFADKLQQIEDSILNKSYSSIDYDFLLEG